MKNGMYTPSGELQGDSNAIPDKGTGTGMPGNADTGGMSTDANATNSMGSIAGSTKSDSMMSREPKAPNV